MRRKNEMGKKEMWRRTRRRRGREKRKELGR
jgi:hypothetical protein